MPSEGSKKGDDHSSHHHHRDKKRPHSSKTDSAEKPSRRHKHRHEDKPSRTSAPSHSSKRVEQQQSPHDTTGLSAYGSLTHRDSGTQYAPSDRVADTYGYVQRVLPDGTMEYGYSDWSEVLIPPSLLGESLPASQGSYSVEPGSHHGACRDSTGPSGNSGEYTSGTGTSTSQSHSAPHTLEEEDYYAVDDTVATWAENVPSSAYTP